MPSKVSQGTQDTSEAPRPPVGRDSVGQGPQAFVEYRCTGHGGTFWHDPSREHERRGPWCSMCWKPYEATGRELRVKR